MIFAVENPICDPLSEAQEEGEAWKDADGPRRPRYQAQCGRCNRLAPQAGSEAAATVLAVVHGWRLELFTALPKVFGAWELNDAAAEISCPDCATAGE